MSRDIKRILESRVGCILMAICCLVLGIYALCFNVYNRADGSADSISEWLSYVTQEDVITLIVCIIFFVVFLLASKNADKRRVKDVEELIWSEDYDEEEMDGSPAQATANTYVLNQGKFALAFSVPAGFTWDQNKEASIDEDTGMVIFPRFTRWDSRIVDCAFHIEPEEDVESGDNITAEEEVQDHYNFLSKKKQKEGKIRQVVVDGKYIVHYIVTKEKSGLDKMQRVYAACDVDRGRYFTLEMWCMSWEPELDVEDFSGFFHFEEGTV